MTDAIGGYFGLELAVSQEYHSQALHLNTGRNSLEYILRAKGYNKIYIPFFTCNVLLEPLLRLGIKYDFYHIDENLDPIFDYNKIKETEVFLYTNYFGVKDERVEKLANKKMNLIIDNAQSFFSKRIVNVDTFYSPRKFLGVPDGAYLYTNQKLNENLENDNSYNRFNHLIIRHDSNAESGYTSFLKNDQKLNLQNIKYMSMLTRKILTSVDYISIAEKRKKNYAYLNQSLNNRNYLKIQKPSHQVPMTYPFWSDDKRLKEKLKKNRIFCATYWPNVLDWTTRDQLESRLTKEIIHLPIDQRYGETEMNKILDLIN